MINKVLSVCGLMFVLIPQVWSQVDLVDVQKKERERRKNTKPSVRVINDFVLQDLLKSIKEKGRTGIAVSLKTEAQDPSGAVENKKESRQQGGKDGALLTEEDKKTDRLLSQWRILKQEMAMIQDDIGKMEKEMSQAVSLKALEVNPVKHKEMTDRINQLEKNLNEAKQKLLIKEQEQENVLSQARREGVPPGWFR